MKRKNPTVTICVGLPASGKTTWSLEQLKKNPNTIRVNRDDMRLMLRNQHRCEPKVEEIINDTFKKLIMTSLVRKMDVIIDNTNLKASRINDIVELVKYDADVRFMVFDISLKKCIERDAQRTDKTVGEQYIKKAYKEWQKLIDSYPFQNIPKHRVGDRPRIEYVRDESLPEGVIFDIDGTIAQISNRDPYDYDKVDLDDVNHFVVEHIEFHRSKGRKIILLSGRDSVSRKLTEQWLEFYGIHYDVLIMREKDDPGRDAIVKKNLYLDYVKDKYSIVCVYDDRIQVLEAWQELGLFTFCVNQGLLEF